MFYTFTLPAELIAKSGNDGIEPSTKSSLTKLILLCVSFSYIIVILKIFYFFKLATTAGFEPATYAVTRHRHKPLDHAVI